MQSPLTNPDPKFWRGKQVLLTGHTGFKGGWLALWLRRLGAEITGIALPPSTSPNLFGLASLSKLTRHHEKDIRDAKAVADIVRRAKPSVVFHLAAQPLVRAGYQNPLETYSTNVLGTANVLDALRGLDTVQVAIAITTDKVYQNQEHPFPYREADALGGHDPYSASKAACELVISSYRDAFLSHQGIAVASARAGNVIGGGDWSEDRLIPDAVRAWNSKKALELRRPEAIRPWQHVLEPLSGYLKLAEALWSAPEKAGAYNFGPHTHEAASVRKVIELARTTYHAALVSYTDTKEGPHEAGWLALEIAKVRTELGIEPRWDLSRGVQRTMSWYQKQAEGADAAALCIKDIEAFEDAAEAIRPQ